MHCYLLRTAHVVSYWSRTIVTVRISCTVSEILIENRVTRPSEFLNGFSSKKTIEKSGYQMTKEFRRYVTRHVQTDGETDGQTSRDNIAVTIRYGMRV